MFKKIYLEISNICNVQCSFCPVVEKDKKLMDTVEFEAILKQVLGIGSRAIVVFYPAPDLPGILLVDGSDAGGVSCTEGKQMVFLAHNLLTFF
jgi:hypothetical protein